MNSVFIILLSAVLFWLGYRFYCKKLECLWQIDTQRPTPAVTKYDGVDYVPARHWLVLFGHHFASIAGAGPVIGPVIACVLWGWFPALIWIVLGTIFIGGVHDFGSLITSVKQGGSSIADIADESITRRAKIIFSGFLLLALILIVAVFVYFCADTFVQEPKIVLPSLGLIPVAMVVGFLLYYLRTNIFLATFLGLASLMGLIIGGNYLPIVAPVNPMVFWSVILLVYCYFASILPVNILLQPRDYLSSFLLFAGVGFGYLGIFILRPNLTAPSYVHFNSSEGMLWPMLFVTIACGAISGFHSLVASGTSSKQLANERDAKKIGYGAMIAEGLVAVLALIAICAGIKSSVLSTMLKEMGPVRLFGQGYQNISQPILGGYGGFVAITVLNAFILTTLDTAARISRYITEELFGIKNRYISTLLVVVCGGALAISGKWNKIWPAFGAANQLMAALALIVLSAWLFCKNKRIRYTLIPAIFMLITTVGALGYQLIRYWKEKDYILLGVSFALIGLAVFMLSEVVIAFKEKKACLKV
ncbi:MAG: carbon starvation protein A [Candidatus Omnitrophota bacterium]|nr:carbon starvation protein A [Candidatus Omnitrophota bacterium]